MLKKQRHTICSVVGIFHMTLSPLRILAGAACLALTGVTRADPFILTAGNSVHTPNAGAYVDTLSQEILDSALATSSASFVDADRGFELILDSYVFNRSTFGSYAGTPDGLVFVYKFRNEDSPGL